LQAWWFVARHVVWWVSVIDLIVMLVASLSRFPVLQVTKVAPGGSVEVLGRPSDLAAGERTSDVTARIALR
jgi:hypothetical protein